MWLNYSQSIFTAIVVSIAIRFDSSSQQYRNMIVLEIDIIVYLLQESVRFCIDDINCRLWRSSGIGKCQNK